MIKKGSGRTKSGVALLFVISILGLLVLIGISFALNMLLTRKEATNFVNSGQARYIAEAGINRALADMRSHVETDSYGNLTAYINGYVAASGTDVAFGQGTYTLNFSTDPLGNVLSEADKVNLNTFDETDTSQINILSTAGLTNRDIALIIDYRDYDSDPTLIPGPPPGNGVENAGCKNQPYDSIEEVKVAFVNGGATVAAARTLYNLIEDNITVYKPIIRGGLLGKYYRNITGASPNVAIDKSSFSKKVVELGPVYQTPNDSILPDADSYGDAGWAETHDCEFAGASAVAESTVLGFGIDTFGVIWDGYLDIRSGEEGSAITFSVTVDDGARLYIDGTSILPAGSWQDQGQTTYTGTYTFQTPGWHKIRLEYYDNTYANTVHLKWDVGGPLVVIPAERLGYGPPTEVGGGYNSAGIYTITSTATLGSPAVATARITATIEVFGTWTQTTKEEFYAAFFGDNAQEAGGVDFRDGETFNVTWLDSCPTSEDAWNAGAGKMNWEAAYSTIPDSLKLGYWDNFDEDPAFSALMMKGYMWNMAWWGFGPINVSFQDIKDGDGDGDNEVTIDNNPYETKHFEVNRYYYRPNTDSVFIRAYTKEPAPSVREAWRGTGTVYTGPPMPPNQAPWAAAGGKWAYYIDKNSNGSMDWGEQVYPVYDSGNNPVFIYDPVKSGLGSYWQPVATFCGCWLYAKGHADNPTGWANCFLDYGFKTLNTDGHVVVFMIEPLPLYPYGDKSETRLSQNAVTFQNFAYAPTKVLAMIGSDTGTTASANYTGWINGNWGSNRAGAQDYPNFPIFKFVSNNQYLGADWGSFQRGQHGINPDWLYAGAPTPMTTYWDDIRAIPENGYLVSTPFVSAPFVAPVGTVDVRWGTVSWTDQRPAGTAVNVYLRYVSTGLPTSDTFAVSYANGASIGGTGRLLQYKAVLTTSNINRNAYSQSSRTPVLEDITITFLPRVRFLYVR